MSGQRGAPVRRRKIIRRAPPPSAGDPALPQTVRIILPPRHRIRLTQVALALIPLAIVGAGGWYAFKKITALEAGEKVEEELQEVTIEAETPPEPEPEPEPESEPEPEADAADPLAETEGPSGPNTAVSLDLALGTGSDGLAIGGAVAGGGKGGARAAYEPGQVDKDPEPAQEPSPPEMPRKALEQGLSGTFVATFIVNASGKVESIEISGGPQGYGFEEAIRKSLLKRRYKPGMAGGVAVPVKIRQPFDFSLE